MRTFRLIPFLLLCIASIGAQDTATQEVFAPFVSRLKAVAEESRITITWRDAEDLRATNLVYRHTEKIEAENVDQAELIGRVPRGEQFFVDHPPDTQPYFYAVTLETEDGEEYRLFIPFRNITLVGSGVEAVGSPEELATAITDLSVEAGEDTVTLRFASSRPSRELLLYRSGVPIREYSDLLGAVSYVLDPGSRSAVDRPPAGLDYYYAVLDAELVKLGTVELNAGRNSSVDAVRLPIGEQESAAPVTAPIRAMPLPFLSIERTVFSGESLGPKIAYPAVRELSPDTEEALDRIFRGIIDSDPAAMEITLLRIDEAAAQGGEDFVLKGIIRGSLAAGDFVAAERELENFLSVRRNGAIEARAHFYLGQVLYFQGRYREALLDFLMARNEHYVAIEPWLDACFRGLLG